MSGRMQPATVNMKMLALHKPPLHRRRCCSASRSSRRCRCQSRTRTLAARGCDHWALRHDQPRALTNGSHVRRRDQEVVVPSISHICFSGNSEPEVQDVLAPVAVSMREQPQSSTPVRLEQEAKVERGVGVLRRSPGSFLFRRIRDRHALAHDRPALLVRRALAHLLAQEVLLLAFWPPWRQFLWCRLSR